ncbi:MAG: TonB-dependent receptor domain-containing protein [Thermaurantiacus tibetensis]|uniref:TonB-dependent receptor domain-containing protein n=1 Tax=Thermaurantiacus tibetensis TaxID=2759035 RepID=UPI00189033D8|nr:TonB-dependent receptor [Thermaurantiacus tibetensis]
MPSTAFRSAALVRVSLPALLLAAPGAFAQQPSPTTVAEAPEAAETIIVTGSRVARDPNAVAPIPIQSLTGEELLQTGNTDVTAALRQIPALISSGTVADSIERGAGGVGQATLNLRQLGSNRTLVLVDGRRHVSGVPDRQAVDVSTIPPSLIEQVEVLTGGASAVYGADAVTGVVNYRLRQNFEGLEVEGQAGTSSKGDGQGYRMSATWGKNFRENRGNFTLSAGFAEDSEVLLSDRAFTRDNGRGNNSTTYANPALRFQKGDIDPATMPNFARFYRIGGPGPRATRISFGPPIPLPGTAIYNQVFADGRTPTAAEQALIDRARNAPTRVIGRQPVFAISANNGLLFRADYGFWRADINGNGINDCNESYIGWTGFGGGGCYVTNPDGSVRIFQDGIISTASNQFGGDGAVERGDATSLLPASQRLFANSTGRYEFSPAAEFFYDAKYARNRTTSRSNYNTFYDSLYISPENPFVPAVLLPEVIESGGLLVSRDFLDLGPGITSSLRETLRFVGGLRGDLAEHLRYEVSGVWGQTKSRTTFSNSVLYDRLFAALDVVRGPGGNPVCRSELDPTAVPPGSDVFPVIESGFFTFRPGQGLCKPANILRGAFSVSPEAVDFITTPTTDRAKINQAVITGFLSGESTRWFSLPGGPVSFVVGGEYRKERSENILDDLVKGLLPPGSPAGPAGTFIGDISGNKSLVFDAQNQVFDSGGSFDVKEVFGEVLLPVFKERRFFHDLSIGGAVRYADYSTVGGALTWNVNGSYAPIPDIRFRGTYSQAIRAPDVFELFSPQQGATFRPLDPCNASEIARLKSSDPARGAIRERNCLAAVTAAASALGITNPAAFLANYEDPLTARFGGTSGGNPNLEEETSRSWTAGTVIQPRFIPGLTLSADYYSIRIEDAIAAVSAQDIVNTCYDLPTFPNRFCDLFERRVRPQDRGTPTAFGFLSLTQTQINFGKIETSGVDFSANYQFEWRNNGFAIGFTGNWVEKLNRFFDPVRTDFVNPGLLETGAPRWAGLGTFAWNRGPFTLGYRLQWIGRQAIASAIQIERLDDEFGPAGLAPHYFIHDVNIALEVNENITVSAGVNNLMDKEPYLASRAYPVSGLGRFVFVGARGRF